MFDKDNTKYNKTINLTTSPNGRKYGLTFLDGAIR